MKLYKVIKIGMLQHGNKVQIAKEIGLHPDTLRKVLNGKIVCSKLVAYCITKYIDSNAEVEDLFERVE